MYCLFDAAWTQRVMSYLLIQIVRSALLLPAE